MTRILTALSLLVAFASPAARAQEPVSRDEHQLIHGGAMVGLVSLPPPFDGEVFVKLMDLVQVGSSYSEFPNFLADPLLSASGATNDSNQTRLRQYSVTHGN